MGASPNSTASDIVCPDISLAINCKATRKINVNRANLKIE